MTWSPSKDAQRQDRCRIIPGRKNLRASCDDTWREEGRGKPCAGHWVLVFSLLSAAHAAAVFLFFLNSKDPSPNAFEAFPVCMRRAIELRLSFKETRDPGF